MKNQKISEDLHHIKQIMESSTTFVSLSGWSGIVTGILGFITFYFYMDSFGSAVLSPDLFYEISESSLFQLFLVHLIQISIASLSIALFSAFIITVRKAKKNQQSIINPASKKFALHLFVPLFIGCLFIISQLKFGYYEFIFSEMLIFFGLALLNSSKFVKPGMIYLAFVELILGIAAAFFIEYSLIFWVIGFGLSILIYGILMYLRYEK